MTSTLGCSELVGTWRCATEDTSAVLTVSGKERQHLGVRMRDASDGEVFKVSNVKATKRTLQFRAWMPSTDWHVQERFSLRLDGTLLDRVTFSETWLPTVPYHSAGRSAQMSPGASNGFRAPTRTVFSFLVDCVGSGKGLVGLWGDKAGSSMRFSVKKVRRNALRVRLFGLCYRGKMHTVANMRLPARTLHFEELWRSSEVVTIYHLTVQKDGSLLSRQTEFETWVRE